MKLTRDYFVDWLERYFDAWKTNDPGLLDGLFAEDIIYHSGPFKPLNKGKKRVIEAWLSNPPPEELKYAITPFAVQDNTGVAHWNVMYPSSTKPGVRIEIDGILVIRFDAQGLCIEHKEWFVMQENPAVDYSPPT